MIIEEGELSSVLDDAEKLVREWVLPVNFRIEAASGSADSWAPSTSSQVDTTRLPKLDLPTFSGCCKEWTSFWEQYCVAVHDSELPDVSKFVYLESLLKGEAREVIKVFALSSSNYKTACKLLADRFGRTEKIPTRTSAQFAWGLMTFPTALPSNYLLSSVSSGYARFASLSRTRDITTLGTATQSVSFALVNTFQYYVTIQMQTSILHLL